MSLQLRSLFLVFGFLQMAFYLNYCRGKDKISNVHLVLDWATNLYTITPQLVLGLTGLPIEAYILFVGCHVATASLFYFHVAKISWFFAVLRALGIHTLTMSAALIVHKRARVFMCRQQQQDKLLQQDESPGNSMGAKQSSRAAAQDPLSSQVVSWPAISTQVVRHMLTFLGLRRSPLHTNYPTPPEAQAGSSCDRQPWGDPEIEQQQQAPAHAQRTCQGQRLKELQQQAQAHALQGEMLHGQQLVNQVQQQKQQQYSKGLSGESSSAADQEPMDPKRQSNPRECLANDSLGRNTSTSSNASNRQIRQTPGSWSPAVRKALIEAARAHADRRSQKPFASNLEDSRPDPKKTLRSLQESCRFIVKLQTSSTPDDMAEGGETELQQKLRRYQCLAPAVRSGCLVISYDTAPVNPACSLEAMKKAVLAEAKEWAQEQGMLEPGENLLTVQACRSIYWDSVLNGQSPPLYSMAVHTPFLIPHPGGFTSASSTQKQQQNDHAGMDYAMGKQGHARNKAPEWVQEQGPMCEFELTIFAPEGEFELRGWQGAADAPEELPYAVKSRSLCLLASLEGQFLGVTVKKESLGQGGERVAQVCVSLPADLDASSGCPRPLVLELWAEDKLVSSYSAMFLPPSLPGAAALAELQGWAAGLTSTLSEDSGPFTRDLVRWMRFQATTQQQQEQQQEEAIAAKDAALSGPSDEALQHQVELMTAVGVNLLEFSLSSGMEGVAGLLLECFASFPFCIPPSSLLDTNTPLSHQHPLDAEGNAAEDEALSNEAVAAALQSIAQPEDKTAAPSASTSHSSTQLNSNLHICPTPASPAPSTPGSGAPASTPGFAIAHVLAAPSAVCYRIAAFARAQPSKEEADYRTWTNAQVAPSARKWCRLCVTFMGVGALRMAISDGVSPLYDFFEWGTMLLCYSTGALLIQPGSAFSEVILAALPVARAANGFLMGLGLVPISSTNKMMFGYRMEVPIELFIMAVMEHVRPAWMVPLRAILAFGFYLLYRHMGLPFPATQAVLLHLCCFGVTAAMEQRYRNLYSSPRLPAKQQASADARVSEVATTKFNPGGLARQKKGEHHAQRSK